MSGIENPVENFPQGKGDTLTIKRRKEIWEAMHPETPTNCRGLGGRGKTEFASETAGVSGDSVRDVQRHVARAEALGDDLDKVAGTLPHNSKS